MDFGKLCFGKESNRTGQKNSEVGIDNKYKKWQKTSKLGAGNEIMKYMYS